MSNRSDPAADDRFEPAAEAADSGGPAGHETTQGGQQEHAGALLGLPESGPGSLAGWGPRWAGMLADWIVANLLAYAMFRTAEIWQAPVTALDFAPLVAFVVHVAGLVGLLGSSLGHRIRHLQVVRLDGNQVGLARGLLRTVLVALIVPVFVVAADGRGLHDRVAGTMLISTR